MRQFIGLVALILLVEGAFGIAKLEGNNPHFKPIKLVRFTEPVYPVRSVATGTVILTLEINKLAGIDNVTVVHGIPSLTQEAEQTVRRWNFQSALLDGKPVKSSITTAFAFSSSLSPSSSWTKSKVEELLPFEPIAVVSTIGAEYPSRSVASGSVILKVIIGRRGAIDNIEVLHGIPSLTEVAEQTVQKWKFQPATVNSETISSPMIASFTFRVPNNSFHFTGQTHR
ncbi:MAG TPA: energy transducer TonB [Terriglobia bacterium]|nr:energy transducer TonB [Terriglobia bacterium]